MVTADGRLLHASPDEHADLLWALKGGGGNFGVVTTFEFALHAVGPTVMFCGPVYPIEAGSAPIRFWREFITRNSGQVGSLIEFSTIPNDPGYPEADWGRRVYTIAALYAGDADEGEALLRPLRELGQLVTDFSGQMAYCAVQQLFDTVIPYGQHRSYWKSHYLSALTDEAIDLMLEWNASPPSPTTLSSVWSFGGATAAVPADATAFGDRSMPWMVSVDSIWSAPEDDAANIAWTRDFWAALQPYSHQGRVYLNFAGHGEGNDELVRRSFGANFDRLAAIKRAYDPDNVFRFNQNIEPAG